LTRAYISVGSNQEPRVHVLKALDELETAFGKIDQSPVYESVAVGFTGDNFLNLVVGFDTSMAIEQVANVLDRIEQSCGRVRGGERFSSRTMDLDLLLFGDFVRHDEVWDIPRREIEQYAFVLKPLVDIAAEEVHPELGKTFSRLWKEGEFSGQGLWEVSL
jgi:2-amino-4-hydroxy-6-hydroxymethyldihydropteridine diphosphokinase